MFCLQSKRITKSAKRAAKIMREKELIEAMRPMVENKIDRLGQGKFQFEPRSESESIAELINKVISNNEDSIKPDELEYSN